jgi:hypothetical protein
MTYTIEPNDAMNLAISGGTHKVRHTPSGSVVFSGSEPEAIAWAARLNGEPINAENIHTTSTFYVHIEDHTAAGNKTLARTGTRPTRVVSVRSSGAVKTWKTRPGDFRAPVKWGLRDSFYITPANAHRYFTSEESAANSPAGRWINE